MGQSIIGDARGVGATVGVGCRGADDACRGVGVDSRGVGVGSRGAEDTCRTVGVGFRGVGISCRGGQYACRGFGAASNIA